MKPISLLVVALMLGRAADAADHLVSPALVEERMVEHARARAFAQSELEATLTAPPLTGALSRLGLQPADVRAVLASLSVDELQDLHHRAAALRTDPAGAGWGNVAAGFLLGVLVALLFWLWVAWQVAGS
jgi:hypothetical protein